MGGENKPLERLKRKTTIETLWLYVLAAIASEGPTYAYNVRRIIRDKFGFKPSTVTLYTVIYRLEREKLLEKEDGVYRLTSEGVRTLREGIKYLEDMVRTLKSTVKDGGSSGP